MNGRRRRPGMVLLLGIVLLGAFPLAAPVPGAGAEAGELAAGAYRCSSYDVSGGGGSCRTMPPLVLNPDGSYQHSSPRGRWIVRDGQLLLSESSLWGPGEVLGRDNPLAARGGAGPGLGEDSDFGGSHDEPQ